MTRSTNADSDLIQSDNQVDTSASGAAMGRPSNGIGSLACAGNTTMLGGSCRSVLSDWNRSRARRRRGPA